MLYYQVTDDVKLAVPRPAIDGPKIFELLDSNREEFLYYLPWLEELKTPSDEVKFLENTNKHFGNIESANLVIWYKDQIAGNISFNFIDDIRDSSDIGYWLGKDFHGKGIATQAVKGMCHIGFTDYQLNRLIIKAAVENEASNAVAKRAGFTLEGIARENEKLKDGFHDENIYSLLRREFIN